MPAGRERRAANRPAPALAIGASRRRTMPARRTTGIGRSAGRSLILARQDAREHEVRVGLHEVDLARIIHGDNVSVDRSGGGVDRKSTRLNSSHLGISYA